MKKVVIIITAVLMLFNCGAGVDGRIHDGDIIFHESMSSQGRELKLATKSRYTHMGVLYKIKGRWYVYEAIQPVSLTPIKKWIARGRNKHYVIKRLKGSGKLLTSMNLKKMKIAGQKFKGRNYDYLFQWSDKNIYCSELVWKIYKRAVGIEIGKLQKFRDFDLSHPDVKALIKKRYGRKLNNNETIISPVQMFNSDLLVTIKEEN